MRTRADGKRWVVIRRGTILSIVSLDKRWQPVFAIVCGAQLSSSVISGDDALCFWLYIAFK